MINFLGKRTWNIFSHIRLLLDEMRDGLVLSMISCITIFVLLRVVRPVYHGNKLFFIRKLRIAMTRPVRYTVYGIL